MSTPRCPVPVNEAESTWVRLLPALDRWLLAAGAISLAFLIFTASRANIVADSVDYYAILQWVTPTEEKPIVRNLHFAEQRSPGYSLTALVPYALLTLVVEPFVSTQKVVDTRPAPAFPPPRTPPSGVGERPLAFGPPGPMGSEHMLIPPRPLLLREVPFQDFYVPGEDSWFQWKLVLALAFTSYLFLFLGMAASARALHMGYPTLPGYCLVAAVVFASPVFVRNILHTPLYATLTAYGASSLFAFFFLKGHTRRSTRHLLLAGLFLGFMVLTRLETGVFAGALTLLLLVRKEWSLLFRLVLGATWAVPVWVTYNFTQFGTLLHLGMLRGDINLLMLDARFVLYNLVHPSSGILFWSPLVTLGLVGLLLSRSVPLRLIGVSSLALLAIYLVRVPIMYQHVGGGLIDIGGISVTLPATPEAMRELVRSDINRYITMLAPFAVLGLRDGMGRAWQWWGGYDKGRSAGCGGDGQTKTGVGIKADGGVAVGGRGEGGEILSGG